MTLKPLHHQYRNVEDLPVASRLAHIQELLTPREFEAASCQAEGLDAKHAAAKLGIGIHTFRQHIHRVHQKLGVQNAVQLAIAMRPACPNCGASS